MQGIRKTKKQLTEELAALQQQIDELKRAMTLFVPEEDVFEVIGNNMQTGLYIIQDDKTIFTNSYISSYSGYSQEELSELSLMKDTVHSSDQARIRESGIKMLKGEDVTPYEYRIICKDGSIKWLMEKVASINYRGKRAILGNTVDITDKKQIEDELRTMKARLESLVQERTSELSATLKALKDSEEKFGICFLKSPMPLAITSIKDGKYVDVNEAFSQIMGIKREELMCNTSISAGYITAEQRELFLNEYRKKGLVENLELQVRVMGGQLRYGLFNSSKITIGGEDFFLTMVTDITDLKHAEKDLRETGETINAIIAASPIAIMALDIEGRVMKWSPAAERIFGWCEEDVIGRFNPIVPDDKIEEYRSDFSQVIGGKKYSSEVRRQKKDGSLIDISISTAPLLNAEGKIIGAIGIMDDITDRKNREKEREELISRLQQAMSEIKTLTGLLPICASCKKIRDDEGIWNHIESYVSNRTKAEFSHSICPECSKKLYPDLRSNK